ncbi:MAG: hypothetical protein RJB34_1414 [Pseudomonadota bacterium]|jgi:cytochrome P450
MSEKQCTHTQSQPTQPPGRDRVSAGNRAAEQRPIPPGVCHFYAYERANGHAAANRLLFSWLSDDELRAQLYADMIASQSALHFTSNAAQRDVGTTLETHFDWGDGPRTYQQKAVLLAHPAHIKVAFTQSSDLPEAADSACVDQNLMYANSPYVGLGGFFMLGLDDPRRHDEQRHMAQAILAHMDSRQYDALATLAFKAGALAYLKSHAFDLAAMAENMAVRYVGLCYGFAGKDLALIESCTRKIGRGLQYQNMARHFLVEPSTMPECRQAVAALAQRATEIMGLFVPGTHLTGEQEDEKEEICTDVARANRTFFKHQHFDKQHKTTTGPLPAEQSLKDFVPILQWLASDQAARAVGPDPHEFGLLEKGLIAAGLIGGTVTNVQNAICIILAQWMKEPPEGQKALKRAARELRQASPDAFLDESHVLFERMKEAMRVNPPAAFLPRRANTDMVLEPASTLVCADGQKPSPTISKGTLVLLGVGGAAWRLAEPAESDPQRVLVVNRFSNAIQIDGQLDAGRSPNQGGAYDKECPFAHVFGGPQDLKITKPSGTERWAYTHSCPGMKMAMHMINHAVRQLTLLPSLSEQMDPDAATPMGMKKRWGQQVTAYSLQYQREKSLAQTPLQTVLPIKAPVDWHAQQLRQTLRLGAPFIEKVLRDSNMVHFASFMFLEGDSKLVLFTMYDGDFDTYIAHFAREFGHLFDRFFSHIAVTPRMPIRENPEDFVNYLRQFVQTPVEGYYFSAYPQVTTDMIVREFTPLPEFDLFRTYER